MAEQPLSSDREAASVLSAPPQRAPTTPNPLAFLSLMAGMIALWELTRARLPSLTSAPGALPSRAVDGRGG